MPRGASVSFACGSGSVAGARERGQRRRGRSGPAPPRLLQGRVLRTGPRVGAIERIEGRAAATEFLKHSRMGYVPDQCARG